MYSSIIPRAIFGAIFVFNAALSAQQGQAPAQPAPSRTPSAPSSPSQGPGPGQQPGSNFPGQTQPGQGRFPTPTDQRQQMPFPEMQRTFFFSGKVVMEDGTPPPESVQIERVCNGVARPEAWTSLKDGRFSFQMGQNTAMMADASTASDGGMFGAGGTGMNMPGSNSRGISERDLMGCELRASLAGFRSDVYSLAGRRSMDNPEIGTIVLHRLAKVDGFTFSATTAFAPKDARKAYEKGKDLLKKKGKLEQAEKEFQKAVATYPKYAAAWYEIGLIYQTQNKFDEARKAYDSAIKADEKFITPYAQLSRIAAAQRNWEETAQYTAKVIRLNPFFAPEVYFLNGVANLNLHKLEDAEESAKEAIKMDPKMRDPRVLNLMGVIHAQKGEYKLAAEALKKYVELAPKAGDLEQVRNNLAKIEQELAKENSGAAGRDARAQ
jgi:Flp pilus assembly protein TadD